MDSIAAKKCGLGRLYVLAAVVVVFVILSQLPGRKSIPPLVESDYSYQLIAADRLFEGLGPTSLQPVAPLQSWDWQYDWGFLTQWPIGYPLLVWIVRTLLDVSTVAACLWISMAASAAALVGWFVCVKRAVSGGIVGTLLAAVAAGSSVSVALLINPSTDAIVVGALPFLMLLVLEAADALKRRGGDTPRRRAGVLLALAGLGAGGLCWIRYASIFVPLGIGAYLLIEWLRGSSGFAAALRRRPFDPAPQEPAPLHNGSVSAAAGGGLKSATVATSPGDVSLRHLGVFGLCAAIPVAVLLLVNRAYGIGAAQDRLNLGNTIGFDFSPGLIVRAWWNFTDFGFYDYYWFSHWVYACWPIVLVTAVLGTKTTRNWMRSFITTPSVGLSVCVVAALLVVLIVATGLFGDKFDYVGLDRYYFPVKPLYFVLFVAPLTLVPRRVIRAVIGIGLLVACSWLVQYEYPRPYKRWLAADREATSYGQWARCFTPHAAATYQWLKDQAGPDLVVVSNFHEYVTLETGIPALPIPKDAATLNRWIDGISMSRGVTDLRVLFVLDPDNRWRDYWIPQVNDVVEAFALQGRAVAPSPGSARVFDYSPSRTHVAASRHTAP